MIYINYAKVRQLSDIDKIHVHFLKDQAYKQSRQPALLEFIPNIFLLSHFQRCKGAIFIYIPRSYPLRLYRKCMHRSNLYILRFPKRESRERNALRGVQD